MRTLVYDPYFSALGGGELYLLMLAQELARDSQVTILLPEVPWKEKAQSRFGLDLNFLQWTRFSGTVSDVSRLSKGYDRFLCITLANPPRNRARYGILIIQFPYGYRPPKGVLQSYNLHLCYSQYCQDWIRRLWGAQAEILYPAYLSVLEQPVKKENLIVSVGRLQPGLNSKGISSLIRTFSVYLRDKIPTWEYYVIGGTGQSHQDRKYAEDLAELATKSGVKLCPDLPRQRLLELLGAAKLYWHGTGFDYPDRPETAEHFGVSIVEALALRALPLVYPRGGPAEIIEDGHTGLYWRSLEELGYKTLKLARDPELWFRLSQRGPGAAAKYSQEALRSKFRQLLGRINL